MDGRKAVHYLACLVVVIEGFAHGGMTWPPSKHHVV
jgi:hypothetical protein